MAMEGNLSLSPGQPTTIGFLFSVDNHFSGWEAYAFAAVTASLAIFTVLANALVIHLTRTSSELKPLGPLKTLMGSMALADLLMGLVVMPITAHQNILDDWRLGTSGCKMFISCEILSCTASTLHLSAIALDRYFAMIHPLAYKSMGDGYATGLAVATWILSVAVMSPTFVFDLYYVSTDGLQTDCDILQNDAFATMVCNAIVSVPYLIIWSIYIKLYCMSRARLQNKMRKTIRIYQEMTQSKARSEKNDDADSDDGGDDEDIKKIGCAPHLHALVMKKLTKPKPRLQKTTMLCRGCQAKIPAASNKVGLCKVCLSPNDLLAVATEARLKTLMQLNKRSLFVTLIIMCTFTICYVPVGIQYQLSIMCPTCETNARLTTLLVWFAYIMSSLNPVIYTIFNSNFRRAFHKLIKG